MHAYQSIASVSSLRRVLFTRISDESSLGTDLNLIHPRSPIIDSCRFTCSILTVQYVLIQWLCVPLIAVAYTNVTLAS